MRWVVVWWPKTDQDVAIIGPFKTFDAADAIRKRLEVEADETAASVQFMTPGRWITSDFIKTETDQ